MVSTLLTLFAALLVTITSLILLLSRDWRWGIVTLAVQYLGVLGLTVTSWPIEMAMVKMVAGWMAGAVLGVSIANTPEAWHEPERFWPSGRIFRMAAASLVIIVVASLAPKAGDWLPSLAAPALWGGLILIGMGLLHLGLTDQPLRVVTGLLTLLSGFEVLYAAVETSVLVAGLLATVQLGLALTGAYLMLAPSEQEES